MLALPSNAKSDTHTHTLTDRGLLSLCFLKTSVSLHPKQKSSGAVALIRSWLLHAKAQVAVGRLRAPPGMPEGKRDKVTYAAPPGLLGFIFDSLIIVSLLVELDACVLFVRYTCMSI